MNGLEAIKLMEQGKQVVDGEGIVYKIIDNAVHYMYKNDLSGKYCLDTAFDFGIEYEEYIPPKPLTGWERVDTNNGKYYSISCEHVTFFNDCDEKFDSRMINNANYFSTKEKAEEIDFKQTLFRKLQRFSDENGCGDIDWSNSNQWKYTIYYDIEDKVVKVVRYSYLKIFGCVYFNSREATEKAIKIFNDDLIKYFTM